MRWIVVLVSLVTYCRCEEDTIPTDNVNNLKSVLENENGNKTNFNATNTFPDSDKSINDSNNGATNVINSVYDIFPKTTAKTDAKEISTTTNEYNVEDIISGTTANRVPKDKDIQSRTPDVYATLKPSAVKGSADIKPDIKPKSTNIDFLKDTEDLTNSYEKYLSKSYFPKTQDNQDISPSNKSTDELTKNENNDVKASEKNNKHRPVKNIQKLHSINLDEKNKEKQTGLGVISKNNFDEGGDNIPKKDIDEENGIIPKNTDMGNVINPKKNDEGNAFYTDPKSAATVKIDSASGNTTVIIQFPIFNQNILQVTDEDQQKGFGKTKYNHKRGSKKKHKKSHKRLTDKEMARKIREMIKNSRDNVTKNSPNNLNRDEVHIIKLQKTPKNLDSKDWILCGIFMDC